MGNTEEIQEVNHGNDGMIKSTAWNDLKSCEDLEGYWMVPQGTGRRRKGAMVWMGRLMRI